MARRVGIEVRGNHGAIQVTNDQPNFVLLEQAMVGTNVTGPNVYDPYDGPSYSYQISSRTVTLPARTGGPYVVAVRGPNVAMCSVVSMAEGYLRLELIVKGAVGAQVEYLVYGPAAEGSVPAGGAGWQVRTDDGKLAYDYRQKPLNVLGSIAFDPRPGLSVPFAGLDPARRYAVVSGIPMFQWQLIPGAGGVGGNPGSVFFLGAGIFARDGATAVSLETFTFRADPAGGAASFSDYPGTGTYLIIDIT